MQSDDATCSVYFTKQMLTKLQVACYTLSRRWEVLPRLVAVCEGVKQCQNKSYREVKVFNKTVDFRDCSPMRKLPDPGGETTDAQAVGMLQANPLCEDRISSPVQTSPL